MQGGSLHCLLCHCAHAYALPRLTFQPPSQSDTRVACRLNLAGGEAVFGLVLLAQHQPLAISPVIAQFASGECSNTSCPGGKRHRSK